ncbi:capsular polysaccharide transport system permease protein [Hasllibacter halocynthiae]|uniref:Capsular polysaccharide transport system permease protein n=1 Tax=Hasllibacter halocynthiae TaxID=595589 RepID=A0A2T0X9T9_9RHOB|nr:capsule biosynthesis protein [Hasllibacter halocynthiae]PRY95710.1 capsular polysaccharide transport system permease protein [Hasllibacter halocynthiae]
MNTTPRAQKFRIRRTGGPGAPRPAGTPGGARQAFDPGLAHAARKADSMAGEVASPTEVAGETEIEAIRREGLTGRQLALARRVAARHRIAVSSDLDAVRQLRARGIDPFAPGGALALAKAPKADADEGPLPGLPTAVPQGEPQVPATRKSDNAPVPAMFSPEERDAQIARMQRDIARRRRRALALLATRLTFFLLVPTLIVGWYFYRIATPMYATHTQMQIKQAEAGTGTGGGGLGGLFSGTSFGSSEDSIAVQGYLTSRDAMIRLDAEQGFTDHFQQPGIDPLNRLPPDAGLEEAYALYDRMVRIGYDPTEGVIRMEVIAADPQVSQRWSEALISYAEERVDNLTLRLREGQLEGAEDSFREAEEAMNGARANVLRLQELNGIADGEAVVQARLAQVAELEGQLVLKRLQLEALLDNARPNQARVDGLRADIGRLEEAVAALNAEVLESGDDERSLARVASELAVAEAELMTRQLMLTQAMEQLTTARIEAGRQTRYLSLGVEPVPPDVPTYPRAFENTILAFLIFAGVYLLISLTGAILREQVGA